MVKIEYEPRDVLDVRLHFPMLFHLTFDVISKKYVVSAASVFIIQVFVHMMKGLKDIYMTTTALTYHSV